MYIIQLSEVNLFEKTKFYSEMTTCKWFPFLLIFGMLMMNSCQKREISLLVFSKTEGFRHRSIETGIQAIQKLGVEQGMKIVATEDASLFTEELLPQYDAVIFLNTTGDVLDYRQEAAFERYIQAGGGFIGIHSATDTEYNWGWYGKMVGAYFLNHPKIQEAVLKVKDGTHPATKMLDAEWKRTDEWYNFKSINPELNVLMTIDETTYEGGENGAEHPMAWFHEYDGGRAFYTALGHTEDTYADPLFLAHLLGGIQYAIGEKEGLDYTAAKTKIIPPENRFRRTVLTQNLDEPMEMDRFEDGRIIIVERKGNIKVVHPKTNMIRTITKLPVHTVHEDGLMGVAIDPDYATNKWIYLCYSPPGKEEKQNVSRFVFDQDSLYYDTEKIVLEVPVQRAECCHSAGSLEFDTDGNLFISIGDNTNPFDSDGFAPIDERKGRAPWDAQKSSANTNDLRGKILRITPQPDGTYTIPEGNLFPKGTAGTRPEIYVMGCRNPFRYSIDSKNKTVFWGDVGPDSGEDGMVRGPKGLDGINVAKTPGFYGWPYTRGNNQAYFDYDFATKKHSKRFDPEHPINDSPNNTGLRELPSARSSLIWYSYDESKEFPWVGTGGKNPMAGPLFYTSDFDQSEQIFPDYFDQKLFIYEWMRNWIYIVKMNEAGEFVKADPFMANTEFSRPMDMFFGSDGHLYVLEYGQKWFARNMDARLSKIEYVRGNRAPIARITADKTIGAAPLTVLFSADESTDLDEDKLTYTWRFTGSATQAESMYPRFTFKDPGTYAVELEVSDPSGQVSTTQQIIQVGNDVPKVDWHLKGNQSFYWDQQQLDYSVEVTDKEDGTTETGEIANDRVIVSFDYLPQGYDLTRIAQGHQTVNKKTGMALGAVLMDQSDCKTCHAIDRKVNGPSYLEIADKYRDSDVAVRTLSQRIINGGSGVWGERAMSAHPQLAEKDVNEMVRYILSLQKDAPTKSNYPIAGQFNTGNYIQEGKEGSYVLMASYTDLGHESVESITGRKEIILRHPRRPAKSYDKGSKALKIEKIDDKDCLSGIKDASYFVFQNIDLSEVGKLAFSVYFKKSYTGGATMDIRQKSKDGLLLGTLALDAKGKPKQLQSFDFEFKETKEMADLYFIFKNEKDTNTEIMAIEHIYFHRQPDRLLGTR